ncbi:mannose-1-phosphate guanylyltransferase [Novosphingobium sp. ZN18A2]|uniref:mannose-1-phosphate guanylyltransferase n=1 Tax=Novosphingobium sp. ZN18A2 TaxID=3079861 RepID=UPI0030D5B6E9
MNDSAAPVPIVPVILCGGSGTRLWPRSRKTRPKPFLPLVGESTLFEATLARCDAAAGFAPPVVVTGAAHLDLVEAQLNGCKGAGTIVEPEGKNTAAAIALAALRLPADAIMLVCPSDHYIADVDTFRETARKAADLAARGWLVTFGITPTGPETGFGYIRRGEAIGVASGWRVDRFVEKPDRARAQAFLDDGGYFWNGGLFAFRAGTFLEELAAHRPALAETVARAVRAGHAEGGRFHPDAQAFAAIQSESVDYAVMENTAKAAVVPASMGWSDIGNWQALHEALEKDGSGNSIAGRAELRDCSNVLVQSDGPRVSVIGASNLIVVVDGDEVLVCTPEGAQDVGKLSGASRQ